MSPVLAGAVVAVCVLVAVLPWAWPGRRAGVRAGRRRPGGWVRTAIDNHLERPRAGVSPLDPAFVLDLCAAAVRGGAPVPTALVVTGRNLGQQEGDALVRAGTALGLGAPWEAAWAGAPRSITALAGVLRVGWEAGASPAPQLVAAAARLRRERRARVRVAAGALGVRLTLPLGLCFLPAFVLLGLVPVVLSLAGDLRGAAP
ncbi:type II secretion system F family protein [Cellulomonas xiejunii]|uniref:Type II secretion system F family protein n=1 Tax=Cellulomonas xiejunii TaxID=2968083 RepID=A0ABY5KLU8_9CELL|nr:type II secretion system F family protein [Cellulomonas xiejunii]MCC2320613.1 type II secretion system F family protein [Cellulomonas xiejunii]UUI70903.1 type II secretion system F family protein [Cellulomonas xiejunii]